MAMSPFAMSMLGLENRRRPVEPVEQPTPPDAIRSVREIRVSRSSRRATSHYNTFQTNCMPAHDEPPAYAIATRHKLPTQRQTNRGDDELPKYTCTVAAEGKMLLQLESIHPLHGASESDWKEVYVVLRGTLLSFHRLKDGGPGKLLKSYTLQHAEVGLASDSQHAVLIPQTRLAHLIPAAARRKAWQKDPALFRSAKQTILRIRAEMDQILLAESSEERVHDLIFAISAAIDISHGLDERSIPRICTVPRRRRRQQTQPLNGDLNDPALLAEQERILQEMYPGFAAERAATRPDLQRTTTTDTTEAPLERTQTSTREEDDLDLAVMREDFAAPGAPAPPPNDSSRRPGMSRQTTASSVSSVLSGDMIYSTSPSNFNTSGKWQPPHPRTAAQIQRYTRRCMPILLADSVRASDVLICNGKRVKINWRMELLEEWELSPPTYKAHGFQKKDAGLERSKSTSSQSPSATNSTSPQSSRSLMVGARVDQIEPIDTGLANLELTKVTSAKEQGSPITRVPLERPQSADTKRQEARQPGAEMHGVVFCF